MTVCKDFSANKLDFSGNASNCNRRRYSPAGKVLSVALLISVPSWSSPEQNKIKDQGEKSKAISLYSNCSDLRTGSRHTTLHDTE